MSTPLGLLLVIIDVFTGFEALFSPTIIFSALIVPLLILLNWFRIRKSDTLSEIQIICNEIINLLILSLILFGTSIIITYLYFKFSNQGVPHLEQYIIIYLACFLFSLLRQWGIIPRMLAKFDQMQPIKII